MYGLFPADIGCFQSGARETRSELTLVLDLPRLEAFGTSLSCLRPIT